ncbi:MAG: CpaD family pilus assembly protein [Minwuiales bacterium]|nr:CpaD family pilus assembly protein [Minwuiales bacterium]
MPCRKNPTIFTAGAVAFAAMVVAGCTKDYNPVTHVDNTLHYGAWQQIPLKPTFSAETLSLEHQVSFEAGSAGLSPVEQIQLQSFLGQLREGVTERIEVTALVGDNEDGVAAGRLRTLVAELARYGLEANVTATSPSKTDAEADQVLVAVLHTVVMIPDCSVAQPERNKRPDVQLGCTTAANLANMVADPRDLVQGREFGPGESTVLANGVARYKVDKVKAPKAEKTGAQ